MAPLSRHVFTFLLILVISFALFTLFPSIFPHPEDFSPYAYVVAFLVCLEIWFLLKTPKRKWLLIPVLIVCFLALLDETGYGSEVMDIPPFYSESLHTEIRDLHNLIGIVGELASKALDEAHWNGSLFVSFLTVDLLLILGALVFGWFNRLNKKSKFETQERAAWLTSTSWFICGLCTTIFLISLPQDPKNAFLFGFSLVRLASLVFIMMFSFVPLIYLAISKNNKSIQRSLENQVNKSISIIVKLSFLIILGVLAYQFYVPFVFLPDQLIKLERLTPLIMWLLAIAWFALMATMAWRGGLRVPLTEIFRRVMSFLSREPSYFYAGAAVLLILVAQLIDQDIIPLNAMIRTPGFHVKLWGLWTEETFEMNGAFMFIAAACYFPKSK
jgi:hypothetical protein